MSIFLTQYFLTYYKLFYGKQFHALSNLALTYKMLQASKGEKITYFFLLCLKTCMLVVCCVLQIKYYHYFETTLRAIGGADVIAWVS